MRDSHESSKDNDPLTRFKSRFSWTQNKNRLNSKVTQFHSYF